MWNGTPSPPPQPTAAGAAGPSPGLTSFRDEGTSILVSRGEVKLSSWLHTSTEGISDIISPSDHLM